MGETKRTLHERFAGRQATNNPHHTNSGTAVPKYFN